MAHIPLTQTTLMHMLDAAYKDDDPRDYLTQLLAPYFVEAAQVEELVTHLYWNGCRPIAAHPLYPMVKEMLNETHTTNRNWSPDVNKERFLRLSTSLSHIWIAKKNAGLSAVCAYQDHNTPLPYAWFHIEEPFGLLKLRGQSTTLTMPSLTIEVYRHSQLGTLNPYSIDVTSSKTIVTSYLQFYFALDDPDGGLVSLDAWYVSPRQRIGNYALFVTRGSCKRYLLRAYMVSPSLNRTWSLPVMIHKCDDEE